MIVGKKRKIITTVHVDLKKRKKDTLTHIIKYKIREKIKFPLNLSFQFVVVVDLIEYSFEYFQV
jgi:hypothetical protein